MKYYIYYTVTPMSSFKFFFQLVTILTVPIMALHDTVTYFCSSQWEKCSNSILSTDAYCPDVNDLSQFNEILTGSYKIDAIVPLLKKQLFCLCGAFEQTKSNFGSLAFMLVFHQIKR